MTNSQVILKEVDHFKENHLIVNTPFDKLLEGWCAFTGEMPTLVQGD